MSRALVLSSLSSLAWAVLACWLPGCRSVRGDEALVVVDVLASPDMPPFNAVRLSIVGRPEIQSFEAPFDPDRELRFGYYLPGPNGKAVVQAEAASSPTCIVGGGTAEVDVKLGQISSAVPLVVHRAQAIDPSCLSALDAGAEGGSPDGDADAPGDAPAPDAALDRVDASDATDGSRELLPADATGGAADVAADAAADARPDVPPPPPACLVATRACSATSACCAPLACSRNVTYGTTDICCGNFNAGCTRTDTGQDCCGQLECRSGKCCLPARYACPTGGSCCDTLVCGNNVSYGTTKICCGNNGHSCTTNTGSDCCGLLRCVDNVCRP